MEADEGLKNSLLESAVAFFDFARSTGAEQGYIIHHQRQNEIVVGLFPVNCFAISAADEVSYIEGVQRFSGYSDPAKVFDRLGSEINKDAPWFTLISPDIACDVQDETVPYTVCIQPSIEVVFSAAIPNGIPRYLEDSSSRQKAERLLVDFSKHYKRQRLNSQDNLHGMFRFADIIKDWLPSESDAHFLARLQQAVGDLSQHASAKMVLTRGFQLPFDTADHSDTLSLFRLYAMLNGSYASAHFLQLSPTFQSLGCSPENVFEKTGCKVVLDVVAATRGTSQNKAQNQAMETELTSDAKERREHLLALNRYKASLGAICEPGSIRETQHMEVRQLRHVMHMHSVIEARLKAHISGFDLMRDGYPPLTSYPDELIPLADRDPEPHRFYAGFVAHGSGEQASCYLNLRSLLAHQQMLYAKAGVGVVRESSPEHELREVQLKLSSLLEAVYLWRHTEQRDTAIADADLEVENYPKVAACAN